MEHFFTNIYQRKLWGDNRNTRYAGSSGPGSSLQYNKATYIPFVKKYILENGIKTVADLGCGDFMCGPSIYDDLEVVYHGYDTYRDIIQYNSTRYPPPKYRFSHLDFYTYKERIEPADLCILKDVLQHWNLDEIEPFLDYLVDKRLFTYILITNCSAQKVDNPIADTSLPGHRVTQLSSEFLPLKKYNPVRLFKYNTKEVSVITVRRDS